jgi:hypothetical protein
MSVRKWIMLIINLGGGIAVLGSYVIGVLTHPGAAQTLWGGVPNRIQSFYTAGMILAAVGYFAFTYFLFFKLSSSAAKISSRLGFGLFNTLYTFILIPSALWMPLTFLAVEQSSPVFLWAVRLVLWIVAAASLGMLFALLTVKPRQPRWAYDLAVAGIIAFCLQTVLLDAVVWVTFFRI